MARALALVRALARGGARQLGRGHHPPAGPVRRGEHVVPRPWGPEQDRAVGGEDFGGAASEVPGHDAARGDRPRKLLLGRGRHPHLGRRQIPHSDEAVGVDSRDQARRRGQSHGHAWSRPPFCHRQPNPVLEFGDKVGDQGALHTQLLAAALALARRLHRRWGRPQPKHVVVLVAAEPGDGRALEPREHREPVIRGKELDREHRELLELLPRRVGLVGLGACTRV
mmetsp:Transcript_66523/g.150181  ORF Transcript_66523/g.150181 Transcript_66523/m.150181 type:complete len:225 (-) Transcript_66523:76-750(-)